MIHQKPNLFQPMLMLALFLSPLTVTGQVVHQPHISVELVSPHSAIKAGQVFNVGLYQKIDPRWHTYWQNAGDSGQEVRIQWQLPAGFKAGEIQWPVPKKIEVGTLTNYGYENEVLLITSIQAPKNLPIGSPIQIGAEAKWLVCEKTCIPGKAQLHLALKTAAQEKLNPQWQNFFKNTLLTIPKKLLLSPGQVTLYENSQEGNLLLTWKNYSPQFSSLNLEKLELFPITASVIENNSDIQKQLIGSDLKISLKKNQYFRSVKDGFRFILSDGTKAVELTAIDPQATRPQVLQTQSQVTFWQSLLLALLGGVLLNLMPCVFPVLSIKILGLVRKSQSQPAVIRRHGLAYLMGVVSTFLLLAITLLILRAGGEKLGWGFQLQSPVFLFFLICLLFAMAFSFSGFFEMGTSILGLGQKWSERPGYLGSAFTGILSVIAATPCTAPFMGTAMGYAFTQSTSITIITFLFLGIGMAIPYLALCFWPNLLRRLPKPGAWMESLKQFLAFPLYATCIWLLWVMGQLAGSDAIITTLMAMLSIVIVIWLQQKISSQYRHRKILSGLLILILILSLTHGLRTVKADQQNSMQQQQSSKSPQVIQYGIFSAMPFTQKNLEEQLSSGRKIFVSFTAAWCITCKANERVTFYSTELKTAFEKANILMMVADWTHPNDEIARILESHGRNGIPLYLYYENQQQIKILPEVLTSNLVLSAITESRQK